MIKFLKRAPKPKTHEVVNGMTRQVVGQYVGHRRAYAAADRKDAAYGAEKHYVRPIKMAA